MADGDVGAEVVVPEFDLAGDIASAAGLEADVGAAAIAADDDDVVDDQGRDGAIHLGRAGGLKPPRRQSSSPVSGSWPVAMSPPKMMSFLLAVDDGHLRGAVVVLGLQFGGGGTELFPDGLAGEFVEGDGVGEGFSER